MVLDDKLDWHRFGSLPLLLTAGLILSWLAGVACQTERVQRPPQKVPQGGPPVQITLKQFSFTVPPGYNDETNYSFKEKAERELLTVSYGPITPQTSTLELVMADRLGALKDTFGDEMAIESEVTAKLADLPARRVSFTYEDRGIRFRESWLMAMLTERTYVQIAYVAPVVGQQAGATFEHIVRSVVLPDRMPVTETPAGFERRQAGQITLDVPVSLEPPRVYSFVSPDGLAHITLSVYDPRITSQPLRPLADEIALDTQYGMLIREQRETQVALAGGFGTMARYLLVKEHPTGTEQQTILRGRVILDKGVTVLLAGDEDGPSPAHIEETFTALINSITPR